MRLAFATDLHGQMLLIERFLKLSVHHAADVVILGGDICPRGFDSLDSRIRTQKDFLQKELIPLLTKFRHNHPDKMLFAMFGNDDYRIGYHLMEEAEKKGIFRLLHMKTHRAWDQIIVGYQFINTSPFTLKDWEKDDYEKKLLQGVLTERRTDFAPIADDMKSLKTKNMRKTILVTHAPPYNTALDMIHSGQHVGSRAIADFIKEEQPLLVLSGHIHESPQMSNAWQSNIGRTMCLNPGSDPFKSRSNMIIADIEGTQVNSVQRLPL